MSIPTRLIPLDLPQTYTTKDGKTITKLPAKAPLCRRVAIYARVSTLQEEQQHSLQVQVEYFRQFVNQRSGWILTGEYIESCSGSTITKRKEFQRLIEDCRGGNIDLIITKSVSRFGRNAVDILETLRELKALGVDVYFENEEIHSTDPDSELYINIISAYAEQESAARSENIKWGIERQAEKNPDVPIYARPCYGYRRQGKSELRICEREAKTVRLIFKLYTNGSSVYHIQKELAKLRRKSPTGKAKWSNHTIDTILTNDKYIGDSTVCKTYTAKYPNKKQITNRGEHPCYRVPNHHPAIISRKIFAIAQAERARRSNIEYAKDGTIRRKSTRYSMRKQQSDQNSIRSERT